MPGRIINGDAIVIDGAPSIAPSRTSEPETFDNATLPANPAPVATPDASSDVAVVEPTDPATGDEASPAAG